MSLTIGQHLRKAREERYITLEKVSAETRIRIAFIKALESDDFSSMPSAAQGRGFLRNYAEYLNINIDEVINGLRVSLSWFTFKLRLTTHGQAAIPQMRFEAEAGRCEFWRG